MIYLDHNATAPILPEVADAVDACTRAIVGNPSSQHAAGRAARRELVATRDRVAGLLGARTAGMEADRLIVTSGGTESNNMALRSGVRLGGQTADQAPPHLIVSAIEHPSIATTAEALEREGVEIDRAAVDASGVVRPDTIERMIRPSTRLVSVMLANHETGVVQPVADIAQRCAAHAVPVHTDATQAVGKAPVDFASLGVAMLTLAAHKFHGPIGVGGLLVRSGYGPLELLAGQAGMERPGTASVPLVVGMRAALEAFVDDPARQQRLSGLRDLLEELVLAEVPGAEVIGAGSPRLPHTSNISFRGLDRQAIAMALDRAGVACSTGSACASGSSEVSPTHLAMGLDPEVAEGALRFSLGALTTEPEIREAAAVVVKVCGRLRGPKSR